MISALKRLFWVSRPVSWINTAYPFAAGYLVTGPGVDWTFLIGTLYFLVPYNLLMYGVNDVFDYESDIRNPRKGGIEGMREQRQFHPVILWTAVGSNIPFVFALAATGSAASSVVLMGVVFMVVAYSVARLRFKERPFLDSITSSSHFVGPLVYALALNGFPASAWPVVVAFFLWGMASHAFGAVQDIVPDRQGGLASIATFLGAQNTVRFALILYAAAVGVLFLQGWPAVLVAPAVSLYIVNIVPYRSVRDAQSGRTNQAWRRFIWLNQVTGFVVTMVLIGSAISS